MKEKELGSFDSFDSLETLEVNIPFLDSTSDNLLHISPSLHLTNF